MDSQTAQPPSRWWARNRPEDPAPAHRCEAPKCSGPEAEPFAVYCSGCGALIWQSGNRPFQVAAVNFARALVAALVVLGVSLDSPIPLYVALALITATLLALPLQRFRTARAVAIVSGLGLVAFTAAMHVVDRVALGNAILLTFVVLVPLLGCLAVLALDARSTRGGSEDSTERVVALPLVAGPTAFCAVLLYDALLSEPLGAVVPDGLMGIAAVVMLAMLCGALAVAAAAGLARGARKAAAAPIERLIPLRERRKVPDVPVPDPPSRPSFRPRDFGARLAYVASAFAIRVRIVAAQTVNLGLVIVWGTAHVVAARTIALVNAIHRLAIRVKRLLVAAAMELGGLVARAGGVAAAGVVRSVRSSAATIAALAGSAFFAVACSDQFVTYLDRGGLSHGIVAWLALLAAICLLAVAWWSTTGRPAGEVGDAATRLVESAGPNAFFATLVSAWIVGILGWVGIGPIRPGVFTVLGTLVLAGVLVGQTNGPLSRRAVLGLQLRTAFAAARGAAGRRAD